jgi:hypothetical protein
MEVPECDLFSTQDRRYMEDPRWALVAEDPISDRYAEDINLLLLSFQICRRASVFIKYFVCKEDPSKCSMISMPLWNRPPEEYYSPLTRAELDKINDGFQRLLEMQSISNRTHNAVYFTYRGLLSDKMIDSFALLMMAIESLFSPDTHWGVTKAVCSRVPAFLASSASCTSKEDMESLYDLRSKIVHGSVVVDNDIKDKLPVLDHLKTVLLRCLKKMLTDKAYDIYRDDSEREKYFKTLVAGKP